MEEIKLLVDMVANLPTLSVYVLLGYLIYKLSVMGSVYAVVRLLIIKLHDWLVQPKRVVFDLNNTGITILDSTKLEIINQLRRLAKPSSVFSDTRIIYDVDIKRLAVAIDVLLEQDRADKTSKK